MQWHGTEPGRDMVVLRSEDAVREMLIEDKIGNIKRS